MRIVCSMLLCAVVMLLSGCASGITRTGYVLPKNPPPGSPQRGPIALQCKAKFDRNAVISLGSIHAYDTGFSMDCDEAYVLDIFCNEGRLLGADLVNITEEHQPNILTSTCYRARAEFLRFKDRDQAKALLSDPKYAPKAIIARSIYTRKRNEELITAIVMGGILGELICWEVTK